MFASLHRKSAFTLIELLVVISIIALLIALLLPALSRAQKAGKLTQCGSQTKQIGTMLTAWANDHDDILPESNEKLSPGRGIDSTFVPGSNVPTGLAKLIRAGYDRDPRVLYCPSWTHPSAQYNVSGRDPGPWGLNPYGGWPSDNNAAKLRVVMISYHYRASFEDPETKRLNRPANLSDPKIGSNTAINADHWTRREGLFGFLYGHGEEYTTLYADMHVELNVIKESEFVSVIGTGLTNGAWTLQHTAWEKLFEDR